MKTITFLGVWMTPDVGETVSFVIDANDGRRVLVDCGTNLVRSLIDSGIDPVSITDIIITHSHGDHISGLPTYLFYRLLISKAVFGKEISQLNILGSGSTLNAVKEYVRISYGQLIDNPLLSFEEVEVGVIKRIGSIEYEFFPAQHQPETMGFKTMINNKTVAYSGDSALSDSVFDVVKNSDILIHDVAATSEYLPLSGGHSLCKQISPYLEKYGIKEVYPVHRLSIYKNNQEHYLDELKSCFNGKIIVPNDGDVVNLD